MHNCLLVCPLFIKISSSKFNLILRIIGTRFLYVKNYMKLNLNFLNFFSNKDYFLLIRKKQIHSQQLPLFPAHLKHIWKLADYTFSVQNVHQLLQIKTD